MASAALEAPRPEPDPPLDEHALRGLIETRLEALLPAQGGLLSVAARDAVLGPGKRVRPIMAMLAAAEAGGRPEQALDFGCAVEMVHAASLVLDDLPCMDDASQRRGRPTLHRRHGEDASVLAAIALLNQASAVLVRTEAPEERRLAALRLLTEAIGFEGLCAGQMADLREPAEARHSGSLRRINDLKTGALFVAAVHGGGMMGGGDADRLARLVAFGRSAGFAFQLLDDLLDVVGDAGSLGKDVRQDAGRRTFVDVWGRDRVRAAIGWALAEGSDALGAQGALTSYVRSLFDRAGVDL